MLKVNATRDFDGYCSHRRINLAKSQFVGGFNMIRENNI